MPPPLTLRVTPAGLFEAVETADEASVTPDLHVRIDASEPTKVAGNVFKGGLPPMSIDGDGALAADVNWIAQNVRWDPAADAERFFGPRWPRASAAPAPSSPQAAEVAKKAMGQMLDMLQSAASRDPGLSRAER